MYKEGHWSTIRNSSKQELPECSPEKMAWRAEKSQTGK